MKQIQIIRRGHQKIAYEHTPDPLNLFSRLKENKNAFLLESADRCGEIGRFSLIGIDPVLELKARDEKITLTCHGETKQMNGDPFRVMKELLSGQLNQIEDLPFSSGGLAGYIGYDAVRHIEFISDQVKEADMDDIHLMLPRHLLVLDRDTRNIEVIEFDAVSKASSEEMKTAESQDNVCTEKMKGLVEYIEELLQTKGAEKHHSTGGKSIPLDRTPLELSVEWNSQTPRETFISNVHTAKGHIQQGDAFQLVFSRRLTKKTNLSALELYQELRRINPSPYMFIIDTEDAKIVGASPETMVHLKDKKVTIHPIAGTRPRGLTEADDRANEVELIEDIKENAEHLMLVDLARNDIGRISGYGTVSVPKFKTIERFSHVMHIVSEVVGHVRDDMDAVDVFKSCFPAGTVSGAPKIRAMSIIEANETERRGIYAGAVGWIGTNGDMDTCIAIRTAVLRDGVVSVQAGGGLVQDSVPDSEFMETIHKSGSIMKAVKLAEIRKERI